MPLKRKRRPWRIHKSDDRWILTYTPQLELNDPHPELRYKCNTFELALRVMSDNQRSMKRDYAYSVGIPL